MTETVAGKAPFALRNRNPDVLSCIANLSSDEVFTPPELANRMLNVLEKGWAQENDGANIWSDPTVRFLDPFTKSGVFLREITKRLTDGLAAKMPDLEERVDHILTNQVYGIGITEITALLARRSLYCSKYANGPHSIARSFTNEAGNIWFERTEHTWVGGTDLVYTTDRQGNEVSKYTNGKCAYCGVGQSTLDRGRDRETHAYSFIHTSDTAKLLRDIFGEKVHFDVVIGNPPYQLEMDEAGQNVAPIYNKFVERAKALEPRFVTMVIPARWMAGGQRVLDSFRTEMLSDRRTSHLVDYPVAREVFPGVEIKGGVCYFLWNSNYDGQTSVSLVRDGVVHGPTFRDLDEFDVFIRDPRAVSVLKKVKAHGESSFSELVSARDPFGPKLSSNFREYRESQTEGDVRLYMNIKGKRVQKWVSRDIVTKNDALVDAWKILAPKAGSDGGQKIPDVVLGKPIVADAPSVSTLTYVAIGPFSSRAEAVSAESYYATKFFRFLVSLRKITQDATRNVYRYVPIQDWSIKWTDELLFEKYELADDEREYIDTVIRPMGLS